MYKMVLTVLIFIGLCEAAISSLQLVLPDDSSFSVLTGGGGGKSSTISLDNTLPSLSNAISEEDITGKGMSDESNENVDSSSSYIASDSAATYATAAGSSPAAITRVKTPSVSSSITSTSGISKGSLLITSSAQASANSPASSSPVTSVKSTATIQHRILSAETLPLPITISTRPGLRTIIAPETISIQQPGIAKVGEVVQQIPTAVSHQRQTVVHNHARVVTPIVAPAIRTVTSQIVRAYHTPLLYAPHVVENQD